MKLIANSNYKYNGPKITYKGKENQKIWEPIIELATKTFEQLELQSVKHKLRDAAFIYVDAQALDNFKEQVSQRGMTFVPIYSTESVKDSFGQYENVNKDTEPTETGKYKGVLVRDLNVAEEFKKAFDDDNYYKMGILLGYPECCAKSFDENWRKGIFDPVWQAAEKTNDNYIATRENKEGVNKIVISYRLSDFYAFSVFRYIGARAIPHIPCSMDCEESQEMGKRWLELAQRIDPKGVDAILKILNLGFTWELQSGKLDINTAKFLVSVTSMPTIEKYIVQKRV